MAKQTANMRYKAVLFDLDGTLLDTSRGIYNAIRHVEELLSLEPISDYQMRSHIGPSPDEAFQRSYGLHGARLEKAIAVYRQYALEQGLYEAEIYDGISELLMLLKDLGYKLGVVTLKFEEIAVKMLRHFNIAQYFDVVKGASPGLHSNKSTLLVIAMSCLGLSKNDCVLVGDSEYDAIGAEEADINFIGILYGFGFKTEIDVRKHKNVTCVKQVKEIRNFLAI
jgi:phosphoglycolate phosphatase